jgi:hypothetical protein
VRHRVERTPSEWAKVTGEAYRASAGAKIGRLFPTDIVAMSMINIINLNTGELYEGWNRESVWGGAELKTKRRPYRRGTPWRNAAQRKFEAGPLLGPAAGGGFRKAQTVIFPEVTAELNEDAIKNFEKNSASLL